MNFSTKQKEKKKGMNLRIYMISRIMIYIYLIDLSNTKNMQEIKMHKWLKT